MVSIITPTFKEAANIPVLLTRIDAAMRCRCLAYEVIIVDDDSRDGIDEQVQRHQALNLPVTLVTRVGEKGLSSAVIEGFRRASGSILVVMDADLSHPPEKIADMVELVLSRKADFVIGSRFVGGGSAEHFNWFRKANAWVAKLMARPFTSASDPMAGFFAFPRQVLPNLNVLNPVGFKICLELLVKSGARNVREVPIQFAERLYGQSKLSIREQILYLLHVLRLARYQFPRISQIVIFSLVGASGVIVDLFSVFVSYRVLSLSFRLARVVGFLAALTSNFLLNRRYTFPTAAGGAIFRQWALFFAVSAAGFGVNWTISVWLFDHVAVFHRLYLLAAATGILGGATTNFLGSKYLAFRQPPVFDRAQSPVERRN